MERYLKGDTDETMQENFAVRLEQNIQSYAGPTAAITELESAAI